MPGWREQAAGFVCLSPLKGMSMLKFIAAFTILITAELLEVLLRLVFCSLILLLALQVGLAVKLRMSLSEPGPRAEEPHGRRVGPL